MLLLFYDDSLNTLFSHFSHRRAFEKVTMTSSNVVMGGVTVIINIVSTHCSILALERFGDV